MPLISFIIPYYNLPLWMVCECLDSIRRLPLGKDEREIIVVDDGAKEDIETQLRGEGHEIIYLRKENGGLSTARNAGLNVATGEYIQFVDGDDKLSVDNYARCINILRKETPDMLVFDFCRNESKTAGSESETTEQMSGTEYMLNHNIRAAACGYVARKSAIGDLRFTNGILHEDEEFTPLLLLQANRVIITDTKAYVYRIRENSIMTSSGSKHIEKRQKDRLATLRKLHGLSRSMNGEKRAALERRVAQLTMDDIYNVVMLEKPYGELSKRIDTLSENGLFPLPDRNYTAKYTWFRRLTNTRLGLRLLALFLPMLKRER